MRFQSAFRFFEYEIDEIPAKIEQEVMQIQQNSNSSTIFQTLEWHKTIKSVIQDKCKILVACEDSNLLGYYITYQKRSLNFFLNYYSTSVETPYGIPVAIDDNPSVIRELIRRRHKTARGIIFHIIPPTDWETDVIEMSGYRKSAEKHISYVHLDENPEKVFSSFKKRKRGDIRKAEKSGVKVFESDLSNLDIFYSMHKKTCSRIGIKPQPKVLFKEVLQVLQAKGMATLHLASYNEVIIAGIIALYWKNEGYYWMGASSGEKKELQPTSILLWQSMKKSIQRGHTRYDLLGMNYLPIINFKKGFNGELKKISTWVYKRRYFTILKALFGTNG